MANSWPTYPQLRRMSDNELLTLFESPPEVHTVGPDECLQELARRQQDRYTRQLTWLTVAITVLTAVVAIASIIVLMRP